MRNNFIFSILVAFLLSASCNSTLKRKDIIFHNKNLSSIKYAKGFSIIKNGKKTIVNIFNPWQNGKILSSYTLTKGKTTNGEIHIPMDSVAMFSATQLDAAKKLGILSGVIGISDAKYIKDSIVKSMLKNGNISEMASGGTYFTEKLLTTNVKAIFYSPYENSRPLPAVLKNKLFIPYLDYTETNPLGRAEWIKFTAAFFGKESAADTIFNSIVKQYNILKNIALKANSQPTVFSGKYFNGQWYVAGGKSYIATLFKDAGANYVFKYLNEKASVALDFETVWHNAQNADFWRIVGTSNNEYFYHTIASENNLYMKFKAFKHKHILYCNSQKTAYFEKSPLEPQLILSDFIKAFHPEMLPNYKPVFYRILNK